MYLCFRAFSKQSPRSQKMISRKTFRGRFVRPGHIADEEEEDFEEDAGVDEEEEEEEDDDGD